MRKLHAKVNLDRIKWLAGELLAGKSHMLSRCMAARALGKVTLRARHLHAEHAVAFHLVQKHSVLLSHLREASNQTHFCRSLPIPGASLRRFLGEFATPSIVRRTRYALS